MVKQKNSRSEREERLKTRLEEEEQRTRDYEERQETKNRLKEYKRKIKEARRKRSTMYQAYNRFTQRIRHFIDDLF